MANLENLKAKMARLKAERQAAATASNDNAPHEEAEAPRQEPEPPSGEILAVFREEPGQAQRKWPTLNRERRIVPLDEGIHRALPHGVEAEQGILGSMLISPRDVIAQVREFLGPAGVRYFYIPAHQTIYHELIALQESGAAIDLITFTQLLRDQNLLETVGGASFVTSLFTFVPTSANVGYYLEIVRDKYLLREIISACTEGARRAYDEPDEVPGLIETIQSRMKDISAGALAAPTMAVPLMTLADAPCDPEMNLLGNRFLCRGGGALLVGPSGIGKSSASVQQDILWSLGREAFGIKPARPLRILCVQAENDDGDLGEMARGVIEGLGLTAEEREQIKDRVWYVTESSRFGAEFLRLVLRPLLAKYRPDLLRLDPLLAYVGGDVSDQTVTAGFLRHGLNPLLKEFNCAAIINHHTPKIINRDSSGWRGSDWMYSGAGSADITNWSRAILVIDPTHTPRVFKLIAAKRGGRLGWINEDGEPTFERLFAHAQGGICWHEATDEEREQVETSKPRRGQPKVLKTKADLKALVPLEREIPKNALLSAAQASGIGTNRARGLLAELIDGRELFEWRVKREKTNPEIRIGRSEQILLK